MERISMTPSAISGISCSKSRCDQLRLGAAEDDLDPAARLADLVDRRPHALVGVVRFAGNLLAAGQDRLDVGQGHGGGGPFVALDHAGDQLPLEFLVFGVEGVALGLADLLDHHLLGGLGADAFGHFLRRQGHAVVRAGRSTRPGDR